MGGFGDDSFDGFLLKRVDALAVLSQSKTTNDVSLGGGKCEVGRREESLPCLV